VTAGGNALSAIQSNVLDKDDFLNLLITQLQNQDPLNPTDSTEFTAQLAQFSSLEQLGNVNTNLKRLQHFLASANNSQSVALIGKRITAQGNTIKLVDGKPAGCDFVLDDDAAAVALSIYDASGEFVKALESENLTAGQHTLYWDGRDHNGNAAANGNYTFEILAADENGNDINSTTLFTATANSVKFENETTYLICGDQQIALQDVIRVSVPENDAQDRH
jgi:flagellar basal-body rod modification protein FlgD